MSKNLIERLKDLRNEVNHATDHEILSEAIAALERVAWRDASKEKPEPGISVLVQCSDGENAVYSYSNENWFIGWGMVITHHRVTHWLPLPPSPVKEGA